MLEEITTDAVASIQEAMSELHAPNGDGQNGLCAECGAKPSPEGHDGCLGTLPEHVAMNACCGHGAPDSANIQYWDGSDLRGQAALDEQQRLKAHQGPFCPDDRWGDKVFTENEK